MKRNILVRLLLFGAICFWSCAKVDPQETPEKITIAIYDGIPEMEYFSQLLNREWGKAGHKEEVRVISWDNYGELPDDEASLLIYDGVIYSVLRDKGLIQPLSGTCGHFSFDWTYTLADGGKYVEPFLLCSSFLIFDKDDEILSKARHVTDITQEIAVPLYSMCPYYYISNLMAKEGPSAIRQDLTKDIDETAFAPVKHMYDNWLGGLEFESTSSSKYDGPARFNDGSVSAIYNFSETIYDLSSTNLTATLLDPFPGVENRSFYVDYMSVRSGVPESTAKLCEELLAIISSEQFQYEYASHDGKALCCLPANKAAFSLLADKYPLYSKLLGYSSSDKNRPMVLGPGFYEDAPILKQRIRSMLQGQKL